MSANNRRRRLGTDRMPHDAGMSLVEVLVGMGLFSVLGTMLLGFALSTSRVTEDVKEVSDVNEQSRLAIERLTRELRQAHEIDAAEVSASGITAITFWTDFNGNGTRDLSAADPEVLTYRWNPSTNRLTLTANDASGTAVTRPVLAANVSEFSIDLQSSLWEYDANGDGRTDWTEVDGDPSVGNGNGLPDGVDELSKIDLVTVAITVLNGPHTQTYETQTYLRNNPQ